MLILRLIISILIILLLILMFTLIMDICKPVYPNHTLPQRVPRIPPITYPITEDMLPDEQKTSKKIPRVQPPPQRHRDMVMNVITIITDIVTDEPENIENIDNNADVDKKEYFNNIQMQNHVNDSQNVHDSYIVKNLRDKIARLIELNNLELEMQELMDAGISYEEIKQLKSNETLEVIYRRAQVYYERQLLQDKITSEESEIKINKTKMFLDKVSEGHSNITYSTEIVNGNPVPILENWIMTHVWHRINCDANVEHKLELETALFDQIIDGVEKNNFLDELIRRIGGQATEFNDTTFSLVCINGRIGRMMAVFTLLDLDPILSKPTKDKNETENEAYSKAFQILQNELKLSEQNMEALYNSDESELNDKEKIIVSEFETHVKKKVKTILTEDYQSLLPEEELDIIITKAQAGI